MKVEKSPTVNVINNVGQLLLTTSSTTWTSFKKGHKRLCDSTDCGENRGVERLGMLDKPKEKTDRLCPCNSVRQVISKLKCINTETFQFHTDIPALR